MSDELSEIKLESLSLEEIKRAKNAAVERLKASGQIPFEQSSHQNGAHLSHTNHSTHNNVC